MRFPRQITKPVKVYHLQVIDSVKRYPDAPDKTISAALLPIDSKEQAIRGSLYGMVDFDVYTEPGDDVRTGDKFVIEGETYYVRHVFKANFGGLKHNRCSISTEE